MRQSIILMRLACGTVVLLMVKLWLIWVKLLEIVIMLGLNMCLTMIHLILGAVVIVTSSMSWEDVALHIRIYVKVFVRPRFSRRSCLSFVPGMSKVGTCGSCTLTPCVCLTRPADLS